MNCNYSVWTIPSAKGAKRFSSSKLRRGPRERGAANDFLHSSQATVSSTEVKTNTNSHNHFVYFVRKKLSLEQQPWNVEEIRVLKKALDTRTKMGREKRVCSLLISWHRTLLFYKIWNVHSSSCLGIFCFFRVDLMLSIWSYDNQPY